MIRLYTPWKEGSKRTYRYCLECEQNSLEWYLVNSEKALLMCVAKSKIHHKRKHREQRRIQKVKSKTGHGRFINSLRGTREQLRPNIRSINFGELKCKSKSLVPITQDWIPIMSRRIFTNKYIQVITGYAAWK